MWLAGLGALAEPQLLQLCAMLQLDPVAGARDGANGRSVIDGVIAPRLRELEGSLKELRKVTLLAGIDKDELMEEDRDKQRRSSLTRRGAG